MANSSAALVNRLAPWASQILKRKSSPPEAITLDWADQLSESTRPSWARHYKVENKLRLRNKKYQLNIYLTRISLLLAASGLMDTCPPWQNTIEVEFGAQRAHRMASSFCTTVERNMPDLDQILITPSSPAVSRPAPSGLHRPELMAAPWAEMLRSTRALLFRITNRPSLLHTSRVSLPLPPPLLRPPRRSQWRSVGTKSSGSLATSTESRLTSLHLKIWWSSLQEKRQLKRI